MGGLQSVLAHVLDAITADAVDVGGSSGAVRDGTLSGLEGELDSASLTTSGSWDCGSAIL